LGSSYSLLVNVKYHQILTGSVVRAQIIMALKHILKVIDLWCKIRETHSY